MIWGVIPFGNPLPPPRKREPDWVRSEPPSTERNPVRDRLAPLPHHVELDEYSDLQGLLFGSEPGRRAGPGAGPPGGADVRTVPVQVAQPAVRSAHPVRNTLLRCFWPQLLLTAALAVVRLLVMYVGPSLINRFIDYTSGHRSSAAEGYYLCATLLATKFAEVMAAHQYNFHTTNLGMLIRSTLISALYNKGLRLSSSASQSHGVGMIVNYMAVRGCPAARRRDTPDPLHLANAPPCGHRPRPPLHLLGTPVTSAFVGIAGIMLFDVADQTPSTLTRYRPVGRLLLLGLRGPLGLGPSRSPRPRTPNSLRGPLTPYECG